MYFFARIPLIWLLCLLSVLLHELGHALGHRIAAGKAGWKAIAGSGPEILRTARYIFRLIPVGGYYIPEETPETKKAKIAMLAGGPAVSLLLTVLFGIVRFGFFGGTQPGGALCEILFPVVNFLLSFNFFQFLSTAIPIRYRIVCRGSESDGLQIIRVLKQGKG